MNDVWIELWTRPGHASFDVVVEDPDAAGWSVSERMGLGEGSMQVPQMWEYLPDALWEDPSDPSNNVKTIARVYNEARPDVPVSEFFLDDLTPNPDDGALWDIVGLGIAKMFGYMLVEPPDWDGSTDYEAAVPDWVYGGRNILGTLSGRYTPERVTIEMSNVDDGTFWITVTNDGGTEQTGNLDYDISLLALDAALTGLANVTFVDVSGTPAGTYRLTFEDENTNVIVSANSSGLVGRWQIGVFATGGTFDLDVDTEIAAGIAYNASAADMKAAIEGLASITTVNVTKTESTDPYHKWVVEFVTPDSATSVTIDDDSGLAGGGANAATLQLNPQALVTTEEQGGIRPAGWEISRSYLSSQPHGPVLELRMWETGDPAPPAGCTTDEILMFNGGEPYFPGVQKVVNVIPGALYQLHAWVTAGNAGDTVRMVVRDLAEIELNGVGNASDEQTIAASGVWQEFEIVDLRIPDGVDQVIVRFGHVDEDGVDPGRIFVACPSMRLGFQPETWGGIIEDLYVAATTGVPSRTAAGFGLWWDERDVTGVDRYLELDFDSTVDSNGVAWIREEELTIKRGLNGLQVLDVGNDLGYEHRVIPKQAKTGDPNDDGVWLLQAFNPGGMDDGHPADPEFLLTEAVRLGLEFYSPKGTKVTAEGDGNRSSRAISAAAEASLGAIEVYLNQRDLQAGSTLQAAAAAGLDDSIRRSKSVNVVLKPQPDEHQPLVDWLLPGNTEDLEFPPFIERESLRVQDVTLAVLGETAEYQVAFGSESAGGGFTAVSKAVAYLLNKPDVIRDDPGLERSFSSEQSSAQPASGSSAGAFVHLARAVTQEIVPGGAAIQWDTPGSPGVAGFDVGAVTAVAIPVAGYYDVDVTAGWDSFTGGGSVWITRERVGSETQVFPPVSMPDGVWRADSGQVGSWTAKGLPFLPGDLIRVYIDPQGSTAQDLSTAVLTIEKVDDETPSGGYQTLAMSLGPIAYWTFGEASGTTATDITGNGHDGTYVNTPTLGEPGLMNDGQGDTSALFALGSSEHVLGADWATLDFDGVEPYTFLLWVDPDSIPARSLILIHKQTDAGLGWEFIIDGTAGEYAFSRNGSASGKVSGGVPTVGVRAFVAVTFDGTTMRMYVDGVEVDNETAGIGSVTANTVPVSIARDTVAGPAHKFQYDGHLDELTVYDRALTAADIALLYAVGTAGG